MKLMHSQDGDGFYELRPKNLKGQLHHDPLTFVEHLAAERAQALTKGGGTRINPPENVDLPRALDVIGQIGMSPNMRPSSSQIVPKAGGTFKETLGGHRMVR